MVEKYLDIYWNWLFWHLVAKSTGTMMDQKLK